MAGGQDFSVWFDFSATGTQVVETNKAVILTGIDLSILPSGIVGPPFILQEVELQIKDGSGNVLYMNLGLLTAQSQIMSINLTGLRIVAPSPGLSVVCTGLVGINWFVTGSVIYQKAT